MSAPVPQERPLPWSVVALTTVVLTAILVASAMVWSATHPDPPPLPGCRETVGVAACEPGQAMETVVIGITEMTLCRCPKGGEK